MLDGDPKLIVNDNYVTSVESDAERSFLCSVCRLGIGKDYYFMVGLLEAQLRGSMTPSCIERFRRGLWTVRVLFIGNPLFVF
jgi:hypothetical protein